MDDNENGVFALFFQPDIENPFFADSLSLELFRQNVPSNLDTYLKENRLLRALSMGADGAWFYREMPRWDGNGKYCVSAATARSYPTVSSLYDSSPRQVIEWIAFGAPGQYLVVTETHAYASDPTMIRTYEKDGETFQVPPRCASFGWNGSWVLVEEDGAIRSKGLVGEVVKEIYRKPVRRIELSLISPSAFFIEYTDGTSTWALPGDWQDTILRVQDMHVYIDEPSSEGSSIPRRDSTSTSSSGKARALFAFGPLQNSYCIVQGLRFSTRGITDDLSEHIKRPGVKSAISLGEGGAWFWRARGKTTLSGETKASYPDVWSLSKAGENIKWVAFGPNGFYVVCTPNKVYASRPASLLRVYASDGGGVPIRCASFGYGGSWVLVEDTSERGTVRSHGLALETRNVLREKPVRNIQLSQVHPRHYFIEYMDGEKRWFLPTEWHAYIQKVVTPGEAD